jgi:hypothetical protein
LRLVVSGRNAPAAELPQGAGVPDVEGALDAHVAALRRFVASGTTSAPASPI